MRNIVIYGTGGTLYKYLNQLEKSFMIDAVCDSDSAKWGGIVSGNSRDYNIVSPEDIEKFKDRDIFITSLYWREIEEKLKNNGFKKLHSPVSDRPLYGDFDSNKELFRYVKGNENKGEIYEGWSNHYKKNPAFEYLEKNGFLRSGGRVLDYGFGMGTATMSNLLQGYDAYGVEVDEYKDKYVRNKLAELDYPKEWMDRMIKYDGERLPFPDNHFDAILCWYVLEHVRDTENTINEMLRVCSKGGCVRIDCPNYDDSYEQHYHIDIGRPLKNNRRLLIEKVIEAGKDKSLAESLNMVNKKEIYEILIKRNNIDVFKLNDVEKSNISIVIRKRN